MELEVISGTKGLSRKIYNPRIQKLGLVITGIWSIFTLNGCRFSGILKFPICESLPETESKKIIQELCKNNVVCFIVTRNLKIPEYFLIASEEKGIPILKTTLVTSVFIDRITKLLEERLAPSTNVHGVLMDVLGVGVLIMGRPGIGKSENALELIMRGHRLVIDDAVYVKKIGAIDYIR